MAIEYLQRGAMKNFNAFFQITILLDEGDFGKYVQWKRFINMTLGSVFNWSLTTVGLGSLNRV